ncbi:MAG: hypothetical protein KF752_06235 [Pirellulaceae bacterium]|nr:hypothetical protein [Pirellulaceae bacterium]
MNSELERQIQLATQQRLADWQTQVAAAMQAGMQQALAELDSVRAQLEQERTSLSQELERTLEEREGIKRRAHQLLQEALDEQYTAWKQQIETDILSQRVQMHIKSGESLSNICRWLDVSEAFVSAIEQRMKLDESPGETRRSTARVVLPNHPRLSYVSNGRGGTIHFKNDFTEFSLWWEYGSQDALALIGIPAPEQWELQTKIPLLQREATIRFIAEQVLNDQTLNGGSYRFTEDVLTIYL